MKDKISTSIKYIMSDRALMVGMVILILVTLAEIVYIGLSLKPSELQVVNRYSAYGEVHIYRNHWYYLLSFIAFAVGNLFFSVAFSIKTYEAHGRLVALMCIYSGLIVAIVSWFTISSILNIWSPIG